MPAAEEQDHRQRRDQGHAQVLADEEHAELHARVLGVVAGDQLGLGLGQVEGHPLRLREPGDRRRSTGRGTAGRRTSSPAAPRRCRAGWNDPASMTTPIRRQPHEDLVAEHLRRGPQAAEQRVLVVRGPAAEHRRVDAPWTTWPGRRAGRCSGRRRTMPGRQGDDGEGHQHRDHDRPSGASTKTNRSANGGIQSSLKKILIMSATTWSRPNGPDPVRTVAVLPERQQPPLEPDQERRHGQHDARGRRRR